MCVLSMCSKWCIFYVFVVKWDVDIVFAFPSKQMFVCFFFTKKLYLIMFRFVKNKKEEIVPYGGHNFELKFDKWFRASNERQSV